MRLVNRRKEGGGGGRRRAEQGQGSRGGPIELGLEWGEQDREWPRHTGKMRTVERPSGRATRRGAAPLTSVRAPERRVACSGFCLSQADGGGGLRRQAPRQERARQRPVLVGRRRPIGTRCGRACGQPIGRPPIPRDRTRTRLITSTTSPHEWCGAHPPTGINCTLLAFLDVPNALRGGGGGSSFRSLPHAAACAVERVHMRVRAEARAMSARLRIFIDEGNTTSRKTQSTWRRRKK